jgi:RNA polymerase sigma-70 factor (ECF subfamily)
LEEIYLITGLRNNDKIVFDYIFNHYYSGLCAYSLRYISDKAIVEDLVQDFFVSLWIKSTQLDINTSLKSYLFASVKNRCLDYLKHNKVREKFKLLSLKGSGEAEDVNYNMYVELELRVAINAALEKLPPRCREIFELSRFKGLKNQEIAEKLNISKRTTEIQISLALKILRTELKDFLPVWLLIYLLR